MHSKRILEVEVEDTARVRGPRGPEGVGTNECGFSPAVLVFQTRFFTVEAPEGE